MKPRLKIHVTPQIRAPLDPDFLPASLWHRAYHQKAMANPQSSRCCIGLIRNQGITDSVTFDLLPNTQENHDVNQLILERTCKHLLWFKGGFHFLLDYSGGRELLSSLQKTYRFGGARYFDCELIGKKVYGQSIIFEKGKFMPPPPRSFPKLLERKDGCRVGIDLGGSDRKYAAVLNGEVVESNEVVWNPYFEKDPSWHWKEINDCIERAAKKLPRVDSIGISAAGIYVDNQVKVGSLFRGIEDKLFAKEITPLFSRLQEQWGVPLVVANDGDVTALSAAFRLKTVPILGLSMGTSLAAGHINHDVAITGQLNELAFAPIDYNPHAPIDEWSKDRGVGANYFSQQAVSRLLDPAGITLSSELTDAEKLEEVQILMNEGDPRAEKIYQTIGVYLGYALPHYYFFDPFNHLQLLGRVMTGRGGEIIIDFARQVLQQEFPELFSKINFIAVSESDKRHGQAVTAAMLPAITKD
jgi:predicted NBD/HSP70 family sugar kinase